MARRAGNEATEQALVAVKTNSRYFTSVSMHRP
jgi:hypothetical protein